jgi:hypothetical protein
MSIRPQYCLWPVLILGLALLTGQSPGSAADDKTDKATKADKADLKAKLKAKLAEKAKAKAKAEAEEKEAKPPEPRPDPVPLSDAGKAQAARIASVIDKAIEEKLAAAKVPASPRATDAELLRRVYLDITGTVPTPEKTKAFLDSTDTDKRTKLVDELVGGKNFGRHMTDVWMNLLVQRNSDNRRLDFSPFETWLEDKFNIDLPWDKLVTELMTAAGTQDDSPATTYFLAGQTVDKWTDSTCKVLLGVQLQCAQCHNHPFTDWKQTEYWGMAGFYMKVRLNGARQGAAQGATPTRIGERRGPAGPAAAAARVGQDCAAEVPRRGDPHGAGRRVAARRAGEVVDCPGEPVLRQGDDQPHLGSTVRPRVRQPRR